MEDYEENIDVFREFCGEPTDLEKKMIKEWCDEKNQKKKLNKGEKKNERRN